VELNAPCRWPACNREIQAEGLQPHSSNPDVISSKRRYLIRGERPRLEVPNLLEDLTRKIAAQVLEIPDHMHLVEIAQPMSHSQPRLRWSQPLLVDSGLKTRNPRK
jgi:hypothetical protein